MRCFECNGAFMATAGDPMQNQITGIFHSLEDDTKWTVYANGTTHPLNVQSDFRSDQFGRASAPTAPQTAQIIRDPNDGTVSSSE